MVKKYTLTKEQRTLRDGILELAAKEGWKTETRTIKMRPYEDIAKFLKLLKKSEDYAKKSRLVFCGYSYNQPQPAY